VDGEPCGSRARAARVATGAEPNHGELSLPDSHATSASATTKLRIASQLRPADRPRELVLHVASRRSILTGETSRARGRGSVRNAVQELVR